MKAFHLKPQQELKAPFSKDITEMLFVEQQRSVRFANGGVGYILNEMVIAPFIYRESCIAVKDEQNIVLAYEGTSNWGVSYFKLPFPVPCEPIHFRKEYLHTDSYFFKVSDDVQLCHGVAVVNKSGKFEINMPADFCPVFDRHAHLLGFCIGLLHDKHIAVKIEELL